MHEPPDSPLRLRNRREFFLQGAAATGALVGVAGADEIAEGGPSEELVAHADSRGLLIPAPAEAAPTAPTTNSVLGPFHRPLAPFRAKLNSPLEPGEPLVVRGRVWATGRDRPLPDAVLEVWQASASGRFDNDDLSRTPSRGVYLNRARLIVDETGYYEFETVKPGRTPAGPGRWRAPRIGLIVRAPGCQTLVTAIYFAGEAENADDPHAVAELTVEVVTVAAGERRCLLADFPIVLTPV